METDLSVMSDGVKTPTPSEERELMMETDSKTVETISSVQPGASQTPQVAKLSDVKKILDSNKEILDKNRTSNKEISVSLQTGAVVVNAPKRNRTRSKAARTRSKNRSLVNPHDRVKDSLQSESPQKRGREVGDTPPSANQPNKKKSGIPGVPPAEYNKDRQSLGSPKTGPKKNKNNRNKRNNKPNSNSNSSSLGQTACSNQNAGQSVPPATTKSQSTGSENLADDLSKPSASNTSSDANEANIQDVEMIDDKEETPDSYAMVAKSMCVAIIDQDHPGQMRLLDQKRFDKLNTLLTDTILSQAGKNIALPEIEETRLHSGAMRVRCTNAETRQWLEKYVPAIDKKSLWHGANLVVIAFSDIPKPHKFNVWIQGIKKKPKDIFTLLEIQNKGTVNTKSWTVLRNETKADGTSMTIGVAQDSFEMLRANSNKLYCGMGKALFTIVKSCKENKTLLQSKAGTSTGTSNTVATESESVQETPNITEKMDTNATETTNTEENKHS